jgi:hypothetical protein
MVETKTTSSCPDLVRASTPFVPQNGSLSGWNHIGNSDTNYAVVAVGDYYGNGTSDILLRNRNGAGDIGFYPMSNGVSQGWHDIGGSSSGYVVAR